MKLLGETKITTIEEPNHLQFATTRVRGWTDLLVPVVLISVGGTAFGFEQFFIGPLCLLAAILSLVNFCKPSLNQLDVSQSEMIGRTNVEGSFSQEKTVKSAEFKSLVYQSGDEHHPSGLYADQGLFKKTCLLPSVSKLTKS